LESEKYFDMFGEEIHRGRLICYAANNTMKMGIVNAIGLRGGRGYQASLLMIELLTKRARVTKTTSQNTSHMIMKYSIFVRESELGSRVMVLENPFFYVNQKRMRKQIEIADLIVDTSFFDKEYRLGDKVDENGALFQER